MRRLLLAVLLCAGLVGVGATPAAASARVAADGTFTVAVTGAPALQPLPGGRCLATLPVTLGFAGTLEGTAPGTIRVAVDAACDVAFAVPPGTYADAFLFTGTFTGTVAGEEAGARLVYSGVTRAGGQVRGLMALHGDAHGLLRVEASAGAGGTYRGSVRA
ncbi:hypothetical protein [Blastococcus xanthinilyticus]|uniref:Dirigent-like protein n=1 Tax=Blastococcus xanthinilyticus TaxID=1564164 RepID=A0A5S5D450_9ACTN|nr:hypothetical protein [Blastococcus xanthinilyticus]TYP90803.1 hypothetical protein BD833_101522 [Blastococcus xanthinilyticus]